MHDYYCRHMVIWVTIATLIFMFLGVVQKNPPKISTGCVFLGKTVFVATQHWQVMAFSSPCECPRRYTWPARYVAVLLTHFYTCTMLWNGALLLSCPINWLISVTTFFSHRNSLTSRQTISDCTESISFRFFRRDRAQTHIYSIFLPSRVLFCDVLSMLPGSDLLGMVLVPLHAHEADHTGMWYWLGFLRVFSLTCTLTIMLCGLGLGWVGCRPLEAVDPGSHHRYI